MEGASDKIVPSDSVALEDIHYYMIEFESSRFVLSQATVVGMVPHHLKTEQLQHAYDEILGKLCTDQDLKFLMAHLKAVDIVKVLQDKKRDMMLGPNTLRSTFVFPTKIMIPSSRQLKLGEHNMSMVGKKIMLDKVPFVLMIKVKMHIREISEQDAVTVFEGCPSICAAGMI